MMLRKQAGFTLIELSIVLAVMLVISSAVFKELRQSQVDAKARQQADRVLEVFTKAAEYYAVKAKAANTITPSHFPASVTELITQNYLPTCTAADAAQGNCRPMNETLWGEAIGVRLTAVGGNLTIPRFELTVPLASVPPTHRDTVAAELLTALPFARVSGTNVIAEIGRPGTEIAHDGFYMLDGSRPLTGAMNANGQAIENVKDISINGLTNRTVLAGLSWSTVQQNNQPVALVTCPPGRGTRKVTVVPLSYNKQGKPFDHMGAVEGRYEGGRAFVRVWETSSATAAQDWYTPPPDSASVLVLQQCSK